jgi:hypothetical protein
MREVLVVVEDEDPDALLLAAAFRRHGWRIRHLDLRFSRPTLDGSSEVPAVVLDATPVQPDVVLNRTATSGLGLSPTPALRRQLPPTWSGRHLAAREEQGLLLACFDVWDRQSRLYNPVRTTDRRLTSPPRPDRLDGDGRRGVCWIVDGQVVAAAVRRTDGRWARVDMSEETAATVKELAAAEDLRLGQVDLWQPRHRPAVVTDWQPVPAFPHQVAPLVVATIAGEAPAATPGFVARDLEPNLLENAGR